MKWFKENTTNLQKMYVIRALRSGMFSIAIIVLFFRENGLSMSQITLLQSLFAVAVFLFEVPTGHFADNYGRKKSIVIGGCFSVIGYIAYSLSSTFSGFLTGEILLAIGYCFVSGADSAIIYDNTQKETGSGNFIKTEGNGGSAGMFSEAITSFIGGSFLALVSLRFPIYFDALLALAVIPVALTLHEEEKPIEQNRENGIAKIIRIMKYSLHEHAEIKWLIIYSSIASTATLTMVWFIQIYWVTVKIPTIFFGGMWAALMLFGAFVSFYAHFIEEKLGRKLSLLALVALPVIAYALLSINMAIWATVFMLLFYVIRGINNPITKSYINGLVSSGERATILSVQSLIGRLMFAIIGPIMGWLCDKYSLQVALASCAGLFGLMGLVALAFLHKHKAL